MTDILLMERFPRGRPVREIRTPVNTRNCPRCDNGEGEVGTTSPLPSCDDALLDDFYAVFSRNMRDLGTPVFGRRLFQAIAEMLPEQAEYCVVRHGRRPVAAALLVHGDGVTEVPSASALRS